MAAKEKEKEKKAEEKKMEKEEQETNNLMQRKLLFGYKQPMYYSARINRFPD